MLALEAAVRRAGHEPVRIGNPQELLARAGKGELPALDAAWNIAEGYGSRNREAWAPVLLEMLHVPVLGSDALTLSLSLDKAWCNTLVAAAGVPVPPQAVLATAGDAERAALPGSFPLFAKPRWEGTAKGIHPGSRVDAAAALAREVERIVRDYAPAGPGAAVPARCGVHRDAWWVIARRARLRCSSVRSRRRRASACTRWSVTRPRREAGGIALRASSRAELEATLAAHALCLRGARVPRLRAWTSAWTRTGRRGSSRSTRCPRSRPTAPSESWRSSRAAPWKTCWPRCSREGLVRLGLAMSAPAAARRAPMRSTPRTGATGAGRCSSGCATRRRSPPGCAPRTTSARAIERLAERFHFVITPYYASLMDPDDPACPIRRQVVPALRGARGPGRPGGPAGRGGPLAGEERDPRLPGPHRLLRQQRVRALLPLLPAQAHGGRARRVGHEEARAGGGLDWIRRTPEIRDVLLTGGDPLVFSDERSTGCWASCARIPHVEILRLGTRLPVTLPFRVTDDLCRVLERHHPVWLNTHFNHPRELTAEAAEACDRLLRAGAFRWATRACCWPGSTTIPTRCARSARASCACGCARTTATRPSFSRAPPTSACPSKRASRSSRRCAGAPAASRSPSTCSTRPTARCPSRIPGGAATDGDDVLVETPDGGVWREPNPL